MTVDELKARREQVQTALTQNHFTLQGHLAELDFQIEQLAKAKQDEIAETVTDPVPEDSTQATVNPE